MNLHISFFCYSRILAILVPIVFTLILCCVTYCIYRYNKKIAARAPTDSPIGRNFN